ncbi:sensor domain-containing protein, partial [Streptomyces sp. PTM05]
MAIAYPDHERGHRMPAVLRAPLEARTWREFLYLLLSLPISVAGFAFAVAMFSAGAGLLVTFLGVPVLAAGLAGCRALGAMERNRARSLLRLDVGDPEPAGRPGAGFMARVGAMLRSGVSWRHALYALVHMPWAIFAFVVSITFWTYGWAMLTYPLWQWVFPRYVHQPGLQLFSDGNTTWYLSSPLEITATAGTGLLLTLLAPWLVRGLAYVDRLLVFGLLGPSRLASRVHE